MTFDLPRVYPTLGSGLSVYDECGDINYTFEVDPPSDVFTITYPTTKDNSEPISVTVETSDITKILDLNLYEGNYNLNLVMNVGTWDPLDPDVATYYYYDSAIDVATRADEITFVLRDYCLNVTYSLPNITVTNENSVVNYIAEPGNQLLIAKEILQQPTEFFVTYLTYEQHKTGETDGCGGLDL